MQKKPSKTESEMFYERKVEQLTFCNPVSIIKEGADGI